MADYVTKSAKIFHGFRIDNCHSTPIHVAEFFLDIARAQRNSLYVLAELFTGNEYADEKFVRSLGINALVREAMQAWDEKELSRLTWKNGGQPIGMNILLTAL
jgi:glycogen debranching enzyme